MKRIYRYMMMATCALLLMGCQKELEGVITATIEGYDGGGEKVYIDNNRYACWHDGDKVNVNGIEGVVELQSGDNKAVIRGVDLSGTTGSITAVYPYDNVDFAERYITIPIDQYYREQVGPDGSKVQVLDAPMMAEGAKDAEGNVALNFKNMGSLVKVHFEACPEKTVRKIRVVSNVYISGLYKYSWSSGAINLYKIDWGESATYVNLYIPKEFGKLDVAKDFYLSIFGNYYTNTGTIPLTVEVVYEDVDENSFATNMVCTKTRTESVVVPRNSIVIGPTLDLGTVQGEKWIGEGSKDFPYLISTAKELDSLFREWGEYDKYYKLVDDIDMTELPNFATDFVGYGTSQGDFKYNLDGNGKTIILGKKGCPSKSGLFNKLAEGVIKNLNMEVEIVSDQKCVGSIVNIIQYYRGDNNSFYSISNCKVMGNIEYNGGETVEYYLGGLIGSVSINCVGTIENCVNDVDIKSVAPTTLKGSVGGLCGKITTALIKNCINVGNITGGYFMGGIVGNITDNGIIDRCVNRGNLYSEERGSTSTSAYPHIGGLMGYVDEYVNIELRNSVNHGKIDGVYSHDRENDDSHIGGLIGDVVQSNVNIENCYSDGDCVGDGIIGNTTHSSSENVAPSITTIKNVYVGGTIGENERWIYGPYWSSPYAKISLDHVYRPNDNKEDILITNQDCFEKYNVSNYQTINDNGSVLSKLNSYRTGHPEWVAWSDGGGGKPLFAYELEGTSAGQFDDGGNWSW